MIYLLRHGLDDETKVGGWSDVPLIEEGINETLKAKKFIEENLEFNEIICSDVLRAKQTAAIVNKDLNKKITYTNLLREQNKGIYNGVLKSICDINFDDVTIYDKFPNGESLLDLYYRMKKLLLSIEGWDENLLITHRGVINMFYYILNDRRPDMYKDSFDVTHSSVHKLDLNKRKIERIY